jgi:DNA polymerase-3 subunit delta'
MSAAATVGQPTAVGMVFAMAADPPHALLLVGPASAGKTTLAGDLAARLLCSAAEPDRPCGTCRACRRIASGNHPDVHHLRPAGAADRIGIGGDPRAPGVRDLIADLALRPVEGRYRFAVVERAHRLTEDAQQALLKILEEPPPDTILVLCADDEDALAETIRSRCARVRLGPVGVRDIETLLEARGLADRPTAARLARIAHGRPGEAVRLAAAPEVIVARDEIARSLLDLASAARAERLRVIREALARATEATDDMVPVGDDPSDGGTERRSAAARRRGAAWLVSIWRDLVRDILTGQSGGTLRREPGVLEETAQLAEEVTRPAMTAFLVRLDAAARRLDLSASPELTVDVLAIAWPTAGGRARR